ARGGSMAAGWGRPPAAAAALTLLLSLCVSLPGLLRAVAGARSASSLRAPGPSAASLRAAALRAGEVHRFITYLFVYDDLASLSCGAVAIWYFAGSLERRVGTVRLCCLTGAFTLLTALLFLLLEAPVSRVSEVEDVRGFLPVAFALLGLSTARSRMRRALVLGARVPVVLVPWLLLCAAWVIPLSSLLGNLCGLLAGQAYGLGCCSCLDLPESLACKLDRLFPFSLLKRIPGLKYIPGSSAERRALESSEINPVPGTYPTQSYCCSSPPAPPAFQMHHPGAQSQGF
ncbi:RHBD2 protein, partial [Alcedo cyanopectus]|nr:RHBD2 protein [Ceyx cyanopectus]